MSAQANHPRDELPTDDEAQDAYEARLTELADELADFDRERERIEKKNERKGA